MSCGSVRGVRRLAQTLDAVKATRSRKEKVALLAALLTPLEDAELVSAARVIVGAPLAVGDERTLGVGWAILLEATSAASGTSERDLMVATRTAGDFGEGLEPLWPVGVQTLPLARVAPFFDAVAATENRSDKLSILRDTFRQASGGEV